MASIDPPDLDTLGGRVAFLRNIKGWSQTELADAAGFRQPTISDLENERTKEVTARLLWAVAKALDTTADYLWTGQLDADEGVLLSAFRKLPIEQRPVVLRAAGVQPTPPPRVGDGGRLARRH